MTQSSPAIELNPLMVRDVSYHNFNNEDYNDLLLKLGRLSSAEIETLMESAVENIRELRERLYGEVLVSEELMEEIVQACGVTHLTRILNA
jgi:hypothetical protein